MKTQVISYKDLLVWQQGMKCVRHIYRITRRFPPGERYVLTVQLRRAAISIASNIAEGNGRSRSGDYVRFLLMARGSCQEVETLLLIARQQDYLSIEDTRGALEICMSITRMLSGLVRSLSVRAHNSPSSERPLLAPRSSRQL